MIGLAAWLVAIAVIFAAAVVIVIFGFGPLFGVGYIATHQDEIRVLREAKKAGDPHWTTAWERNKPKSDWELFKERLREEQREAQKLPDNVVQFPERDK